MLQQSAVIIEILLLGLGILGTANQNRMSALVQEAETNSREEPWKKCGLTADEMPAYGYFINDSEKMYSLTWKAYAADVVYEYAHDTGMENEEWELKQIYHYRDGIYQVYTKSESGNELYILLDSSDVRPCYIIAADIRQTESEDIVLGHGKGSYNSMLEWHSYEKWFSGETKMEESIRVDVIGGVYDSYLLNHSYYAIYDYLERFGKDKGIPWEIDENTSYTGDSGTVISVSCIAGTEKVILYIDTYNETYAVFPSKTKAQLDVKQEIETYMEEFAGMYTSEACGGKQKIFVRKLYLC